MAMEPMRGGIKQAYFLGNAWPHAALVRFGNLTEEQLESTRRLLDNADFALRRPQSGPSEANVPDIRQELNRAIDW